MNKKGFSLIEVLCVTLILGILATVTYSGFSKIIKDRRISEYKSLEGELKTVLKNYNLANQLNLWGNNDNTYDLSLDEINSMVSQDICKINKMEIVNNNGKYDYLVCISCYGYNSEEPYCS